MKKIALLIPICLALSSAPANAGIIDFFSTLFEPAGSRAPKKEPAPQQNNQQDSTKQGQGNSSEPAKVPEKVPEKTYDFKALKDLKSCTKHFPWGSHIPNDDKYLESLYLLCKKSYAVMYDYKRKTTIWATEVIENDNMSKPMVNTEKLKYLPDSYFPLKDQNLISQYNFNGYVPAALIPITDLAFDSFYANEGTEVGNYIPMNEKVFNKTWKPLEALARAVAKKRDKSFILSGAVYKNENNIINGVLVPTHVYKAIFTKNKESLAFIIPNKDCANACDYMHYRVAFDEIERFANIKMHVDLQDFYRKELDQQKGIGITLND